MQQLYFYVQGSAREPYRITAEGEGASLRMFCTCPAGRNGGKSCKHIAYLLQGDVTNMLDGRSDDVGELRQRSIGSALMDVADRRVDSDLAKKPYEGIRTVAEALARFGNEISGLGWVASFSKGETERDEDRLSLFEHFKNGKLRKTSSVDLAFIPFELEVDVDWNFSDLDASTQTESWRRRAKPWSVVAKGSSQGTWGDPEKAAECFMASARSLSPN